MKVDTFILSIGETKLVPKGGIEPPTREYSEGPLLGQGCVKTIWQSTFLGQHLTNEPPICISKYKNPTSSSETRNYRGQFPLELLRFHTASAESVNTP